MKAKWTIQRISEPLSTIRYFIVLDETDFTFGWAAPGRDFAVFDSSRDARDVLAKMGRYGKDAVIVPHSVH